MSSFFKYSVEDTLNMLKVTAKGLNDKDINARRQEQGFNELVETHKKSPVEFFFNQFKDFLVLILVGAAALSAFLGKWESALVIILVVLFNALLGVIQYVKTEQSLQSLKSLSAPKTKVLRNGQKIEIASRELLVGDIVFLEAGDFVSADGRIIESFNLQVNESSLTGESESVLKTSEQIMADSTVIGDRKNMVFSGSFITHGRAIAVVTAIGMNTEIGLIAHLIEGVQDKKTPLQAGMDAFGQKLAGLIIGVAAVIFMLNSVVRGHDFIESMMFAVALAVAAIPEALSAIVTIVLAIGTQKMARERAIVRHLHAVESLGSITVICSDKTGTLTQNKMSVQKIYVNEQVLCYNALNSENTLEKNLILMALLCNDAVTVQDKEIGDPTEVALVNLGEIYHLDELHIRKEHPRIGEVPFDSGRKLMSTVNRFGDKVVMITKGAPDVLLAKATGIATLSGNDPLTAEKSKAIQTVIHKFSADGLRVLAVGYQEISEDAVITAENEKALIFLGLIAMMDPPREETIGAVADCIRAGIKPIMITGDHKITAMAIAEKVGILRPGDEALEGIELDSISDKDLLKCVGRVSVYARVSPEHKIRIVKAWQEAGHIVAMTGDGVNDAPAIKQADIGIAMGITGTEVAKDAADIVLADDNFSTIVKAVATGRTIYSNIKNSIKFLLSGNAAGIMAVFYASLMSLPIPFAPVHLLFINLITDSFPAIAIGLETHQAGIMAEKPRHLDEPLISIAFVREILWEGFLIAGSTMAAFHIGLMLGGAITASTMAFATLCLSRLLHGFNCRAKESVFHVGVFSNKLILLAIIIGLLLLEIVLRYDALSSAFEVGLLTGYQHGVVYVFALIPLMVVQSYKLMVSRKN